MENIETYNVMAGSIFKWDVDTYFEGRSMNVAAVAESAGFFPLKDKTCPYCGFLLIEEKAHKETRRDISGRPTSLDTGFLIQCDKCGWYRAIGGSYSYIVHLDYAWFGRQAILRKFAIDDATKVSLAELGTFLKRNFADIYSISWRRFEELTEDIFRNIGYRTRLTRPANDGGCDVILLDAGGNKQALVEVKKFSAERKVGVDLVRKLLGAQLIHRVKKSYLVTTSDFSMPAKKLVDGLGAIDLPPKN